MRKKATMKKREMEIVGKKVTFEEAEEDEISFWANKTWKERLKEAERLRKIIWTHLLGKFPEKMQKTGEFVKWSSLEK
jgi:hypothetical protein